MWLVIVMLFCIFQRIFAVVHGHVNKGQNEVILPLPRRVHFHRLENMIQSVVKTANVCDRQPVVMVAGRVVRVQLQRTLCQLYALVIVSLDIE